MLEADKKVWDPIALFHSKLETSISGKPLRTWVPPRLTSELETFIRDYSPTVQVEGRRDEIRRTIEVEELVLEETYFLACELSLAIQLATVRHIALRDDLKPRIGHEPEEHALNLRDMSQRLVDFAPQLKERKVEVKLDERHAPGKVKAQLEKHQAAEARIRVLRASRPAESQRQEQLRARGAKLQTSINRFLSSFFEGDRATQIAFGLTERIVERPPKLEPEAREAVKAAKALAKQVEKDAIAAARNKARKKLPAEPAPLEAPATEPDAAPSTAMVLKTEVA